VNNTLIENKLNAGNLHLLKVENKILTIKSSDKIISISKVLSTNVWEADQLLPFLNIERMFLPLIKKYEYAA